jgi:hypothetical protein
MPNPARPLPHVALATFCERVIQDKADDVIGVFRIYDSITMPATAKGQYAELTVVISLRSGEARGTYKVEFVFHPPGGAARVRLSSTPASTFNIGGVPFPPGDTGVPFLSHPQLSTIAHRRGSSIPAVRQGDNWWKWAARSKALCD